MEPDQLLGASFDCPCGRHHAVPTEHLIYTAAAFQKLPEIAKEITDGSQYLIIADTRTFEVAGKGVASALKSANIEASCFIVPDGHGGTPATDDYTRDLILAETAPADLYISVGSGVINDLVKWIAFLRKKPYIAVATAASMNGYGSANVAATIDGLKVLFPAAAPKAVFVQPDILLGAPYELTAAGLGDVLAKPVSSADWKLNQFLFNDYYCQFAVDLLKDLEPVYLENPTKILELDAKGFQALFHALFYSSIAMTVTGTSSPASGGEHLISHTLDILAGRDDCSHDLHGRQVGVSSILMAALYERILAIDRPRFVEPPEQVDPQFWGSLTDVVAPEYEKKRARMKEVTELLSQPQKWQSLKAVLRANLIAPVRLKQCLQQAGAAHIFSDIRYNSKPLRRETFMAVVCHANQMRDRFTILDMGVLLDIIPKSIGGIIDSWVTH